MKGEIFMECILTG
jgi:hypothetical protein